MSVGESTLHVYPSAKLESFPGGSKAGAIPWRGRDVVFTVKEDSPALLDLGAIQLAAAR